MELFHGQFAGPGRRRHQGTVQEGRRVLLKRNAARLSCGGEPSLSLRAKFHLNGHSTVTSQHYLTIQQQSRCLFASYSQGIENFWSLLKRTHTGTYVVVEPFHLDAYADEQAFRFDHRASKDNPLDDADRFMLALSQISGKRLTYAELTGKVGQAAF